MGKSGDGGEGEGEAWKEDAGISMELVELWFVGLAAESSMGIY